MPTKEKHKKHKVADDMSSELGILSFELFSASPAILNYTILNLLDMLLMQM